MIKRLTLAVSLALLTACQSVPKSDITPIVQQEKSETANTINKQSQSVYDYKLDNGLRVIIKPQNSPLVMTQIWYDVGSNNEYVGVGGISHFLEHMMFKESAGIDGDIYDKVVNHFGGSRNAFTSDNYTSYYQLLPANQYPLGLEIEANRMRGLVFNQDKFDKEKEVVKEERRQRTDDNPLAKAFEEFAPKLFDNKKARPIIGYMHEIDGISLPQMQKWYDAYYHPNRATLVIVGGVKVDEAKAWVDKYFAHIPKEPLSDKPIAPPPNLTQKLHRGYQEFTTYQEVSVPTLVIAYNVPTLSTANNPKEAYALGLFSDLADGGNSARFNKHLVRGKEVLTSVSAGYDFYEKGDDVFYVSATPREGVSLEQAKTAILDELDTLMTGQIDDKELKRGQIALQSTLILQNDSITSQASSLGRLAMLGRPLDDFEKLPNELKAISKDDIQAVAKKYLVKDNMSVMYVLPKADEPKLATKPTKVEKKSLKPAKKAVKKGKKAAKR